MSNTVTIRKKPKIWVRILTAILCIGLGLVMVSASFLPAVSVTVSSLIDADNLAKLMDEIDFDAAFDALESNSQITSDAKAMAKLVKDMITTDYGKDLLFTYIASLAAQARGEEANVELDGDMLYDYMKSHLDDIEDTLFDSEEMTALNDAIKEGLVSQEEVDTTLNEAIKEVAYAIAESMPNFEELIENFGIAAEAITAFISKVFILTVAGIMAVLAILTYVLKLWKRKGLVWLAVDFGISTVMIGACGFSMMSAGRAVEIIAEQALSFMTPITAPFLAFIGRKLLLVACVYLVLVLICVAWKLIYDVKLKRAIAGADETPKKKEKEHKPEDYVSVNVPKPEAKPEDYVEVEKKDDQE